MVLIRVNRMRLTLLVVAAFTVFVEAKVTKKSQKDVADPITTKGPTKKTTPLPPAIVAIEIVDPKQNSTKARKRTIDSSLGYGYESFFNVRPKAPKYEVYKYSQQDIPPPKVHHAPAVVHNPGHNFEIQKSIRYDLGSTKPVFIPAKQQQQHYEGGTTLFSTLDQNGHLGGLSSHVPSQHGPMVPVIILRVYTNQLEQPGALYPNIPRNHPYASLNHVDLQSLLSRYQQGHQQPVQQQQEYQAPQQYYQPQTYLYQQPQYYQQVYQQQQPDYDDGLLTNENYPDDSHTKVIFHKQPKVAKAPKQPAVAYKTATPQKFKITIPENTYSKVEIQEHTVAPQQQQQVYYQDQYYQPQQYHDANQYVQIATYPQDQHQQYQEYQEGAQYPPQEHSQNYVTIPVQENQQDDNQDYLLHKSSTEAGRDLHTKLYNYHAHGPLDGQKVRTTNKKRKVRMPIALAIKEVKKVAGR